MLSDPDICVHGKRLTEGCFFCGTKTFAETAAADPLQHRNPPAAEPKRRFGREDSNRRGGENARRADIAGRKGGQSTQAKRRAGVSDRPKLPPGRERALEYLKKAILALGETPGNDSARYSIRSAIAILEKRQP